MRRKDKGRSCTLFFGKLRERLRNPGDVCFDEQRVVVKSAELFDLWCVGSNCFARSGNILEILPATRIRTVGGGDKGERVFHTIVTHFAQCIAKQRMPIAIAEIDRQTWSISCQFLLECRDEFSILFVDRTDAAKQLVMLRNAKHSLSWHVTALQHIFQKRDDVAHSFRAAERNYQDGIIWRGGGIHGSNDR